MMEKLGQAKTHLELKKMIAEVDTTNKGKIGLLINNTCSTIYILCVYILYTGTINYPDFLTMMLGKKSSVLKL